MCVPFNLSKPYMSRRHVHHHKSVFPPLKHPIPPCPQGVSPLTPTPQKPANPSVCGLFCRNLRHKVAQKVSVSYTLLPILDFCYISSRLRGQEFCPSTFTILSLHFVLPPVHPPPDFSLLTATGATSLNCHSNILITPFKSGHDKTPTDA